MPRYYKRRLGALPYCNYPKQNLELSLASILDGHNSIRDAAERFGVPKSTLFRKYRGQNSDRKGRPPVLNKTEEDAIVNALTYAANCKIPFTEMDLRLFVQDYLNRKGVRVPVFYNNLPGYDWLRCFLSRNKVLSVRLSENVKRVRAEITAETINSYFDNLEETLAGIEPSKILNYDETNMCDDPGKSRVIVRRGIKHTHRALDSSKSSVSVMFSATADGILLPPYIVYRAKNLYPEWIENGPENAIYNRSKSGWFESHIFEDWLVKIAFPYFKKFDGKKAILGDNLASHISVSVLKKCEENNISFILLPANSTHICQPLDVAVFRPLKMKWRKVLTSWKQRHRGCIPKAEFPSLLKATLQQLGPVVRDNIMSGFRSAGISPVDRSQVLKHITEPENDANDSALIQALKNVVKTHVLPSESPITEKKRKKKLNVPSGKSVSASDLSQENFPEAGNSTEQNETEEMEENLLTEDDAEENILTDEGDENLLETTETENNKMCLLTEGRFVLVKFVYNEGTKKETNKLFVSEIVKCNKKTFEISCLRPFQNKKNVFVYPQVIDNNKIKKEQILKVLPYPHNKRGIYYFNVNIDF